MSSSSSYISYLSYVGQMINIYVGLPVLVAGVVGGVLNIIIFLSLRTFRENSCAFYLTVMSAVNVGQLLTGMLSRIMISGFSIDWTQTSLMYCKCRLLIYQLCASISYTSLCLATIDQYLATSTRPRWQQWCNIKLAHRLVIGTSLVWMLHAIPYAIFLDHTVSPSTQAIACTTTNGIFLHYRAYFITLVLTGFLPVSITTVFGIMAFRNVKQLAYRTIPLVRRELDTQLTVMVLVQVVVNFFTNIPLVIMNTLTVNPGITSDRVVWARLQFAFSVTLVIFYSYFAVSKRLE